MVKEGRKIKISMAEYMELMRMQILEDYMKQPGYKHLRFVGAILGIEPDDPVAEALLLQPLTK